MFTTSLTICFFPPPTKPSCSPVHQEEAAGLAAAAEAGASSSQLSEIEALRHSCEELEAEHALVAEVLRHEEAVLKESRNKQGVPGCQIKKRQQCCFIHRVEILAATHKPEIASWFSLTHSHTFLRLSSPSFICLFILF